MAANWIIVRRGNVKGQIVCCYIARARQRDQRVATDRLAVTLRELHDGTSGPKM